MPQPIINNPGLLIYRTGGFALLLRLHALQKYGIHTLDTPLLRNNIQFEEDDGVT